MLLTLIRLREYRGMWSGGSHHMEGEGEEDSGDSRLLIRRAFVRDARAIYAIHLKSLGGVDREDIEWFEELLRARSRRVKVLVAELEGEVVGFAIAYKNRDRAYIDYLAVDPRYRGLGVGSTLLKSLEELLAVEGVREVSLSVKSGNLPALQFYIRNGYAVRNVVLVLSAKTSEIAEWPLDGYKFEVTRGSVGRVRARFMSTAWWSTVTEDADRLVYRKLSDEYALLLYKGSKLRGLAEFSPRRVMSVDYIAVSYNKPGEALKALVRALGEEARSRSVEEILVYVDGSKTRMANALLELNFKTVKTEYRMSKKLVE